MPGIAVVLPLALLGLMYLSACKDVLRDHRPKPTDRVFACLGKGANIMFGHGGPGEFFLPHD